MHQSSPCCRRLSQRQLKRYDFSRSVLAWGVDAVVGVSYFETLFYIYSMGTNTIAL
jgi:hypothetical protein